MLGGKGKEGRDRMGGVAESSEHRLWHEARNETYLFVLKVEV